MPSWNEYANYTDSDETLEDFFNRAMSHTVWKMFEHQEDWIHMYGELGERSKPKVKSFDKLREEFDYAWRNSGAGFMQACAFWAYVQSLVDDDIELDEETEWELRCWRGEDE